MKLNIKGAVQSYTTLALVVYVIIIIFRILEAILIAINHEIGVSVIGSELLGICYDILLYNTILLLLLPLYLLVYNINKKLSGLIFMGLVYMLTLAHFVILKYFLYQLSPLDVFLYNYSVKEILFTLKTSDTSIFKNLFLLLLLLASVSVCFKITRKKVLNNKFSRVVLTFISVSLPLFFIGNSIFSEKTNKFSENKSALFITASFNHFFNRGKENSTNSDIQAYHRLYPQKKFIDALYPLVYKANRTNVLEKYFEPFDNKPNIVILIVEGLNDDFIHTYQGTMLMPFLNKLKDESLYWNRCFTLGERSFAIVPCILGGLPYGEKGFTLLDKLPRHLSLVSVLNANNYNTAFFDGQGSWFHRKDRFFRYNNTDLIVDNSRFSEKYKKIIVGDDHFFWGYNDKDLFHQSLEIIDTLKAQSRLDIYFTGTSHSPFALDNNDYYSSKLKQHVLPQNEKFFTTYAKYLKTILFVNDALEGFFSDYKKRDDYRNTIFIITGDHPMTEIPIANSLKRYHVPLIIFSEKLKKHQTFTNTVSHLDVSETLLNLLQNNISIIPSVSTSLGDLLISTGKHTPKRFAFMNDNREIVDYYSDGYYLSDNYLYEVDSCLSIKEIKNTTLKTTLTNELNTIKKISLSTSVNNKIISNDRYCNVLKYLNIYSAQNNDTINTSSEYYNLTPSIKMPNMDVTLDIDMNIKVSSGQETSIVYQINDNKDSTLLWKSISIDKASPFIQAHININRQLVSDTVVYFRTYLWNKKRNDVEISNMNILLHSKKTIHEQNH